MEIRGLQLAAPSCRLLAIVIVGARRERPGQLAYDGREEVIVLPAQELNRE
jgi:hypothetical protein